MYISLHVKCPLFLSDINKNLNFRDRFFKNPQMSNFMKIRPVVAELFHADGRVDRRADMTKLIVAFRNFAKAANERPMTDHRAAREYYDGPSIDGL